MSLQRFGITYAYEEHGIPVKEFTNKEVLIPFVIKYGTYFNTDSLAIASSMFVKRYAVLTGAAALEYYGMNKNDADWWSSAKVNPNKFTLTVEENLNSHIGSRDWKSFILSDHLCKIVDILSEEGKVPKKLLWENVAVRLNSVIREQLTKCEIEVVKDEYEKLKQFSYESNGKVIFPFQNIIHMEFLDDRHPKRKTCCRYYEVSLPNDLPYCLVCPLEAKRE